MSPGDNEGDDDASVLLTPTVSFDVRGPVTKEIAEGRPDRFLMEVRGEEPFDLGDDAAVVFDTSMLRCASGEDIEGSPAPGDEVWLQGVGGISESDLRSCTRTPWSWTADALTDTGSMGGAPLETEVVVLVLAVVVLAVLSSLVT